MDFENLDLIYKNSFCMCDSSVCENCESLEKKVHYLVKTMDRLSKGKFNFESKSGLGFNPQSKKNGISKPFSTVPENQPIKISKQTVVTCFYCMKRGHFVRLCRIRKILVPKGILKWIPRNINGSDDKSNMKGPKFFKGSNLVI